MNETQQQQQSLHWHRKDSPFAAADDCIIMSGVTAASCIFKYSPRVSQGNNKQTILTRQAVMICNKLLWGGCSLHCAALRVLQAAVYLLCAVAFWVLSEKVNITVHRLSTPAIICPLLPLNHWYTSRASAANYWWGQGSVAFLCSCHMIDNFNCLAVRECLRPMMRRWPIADSLLRKFCRRTLSPVVKCNILICI